MGTLQTLISNSATRLGKSHVWRNVFIISPIAASVSAVLLILHLILRARVPPNANNDLNHEANGTEENPGKPYIVMHVQTLGGPVIFVFRCVRLLCCLALLFLSIRTILVAPVTSDDVLWIDGGLCGTFAYTSFLSLLSVIGRPSTSKLACTHLATILAITWGIYAYRDLWPFATFNLEPMDAGEGRALWIKVALLSLSGVFVPLVSPRQYTPADPQDPKELQVTPEQTASILSLMFFFFMDGIIIKAWRVSHLPIDEFPPTADYDATRHLVKRSYLHLDPFQVKKRHLFWGLMSIFYKEYITMMAMIVLVVLSTLASPIGINRLLQYLESGGETAVIRPWVWIAWLFLGPTLRSLAFQWYIFTATRTRVRAEAMITSLIFDHSLRIRVSAETDKQTSDESQSTSATATPDSVSVVEVLGDAESADSISEGDAATLHASTTSGTSRAPVDKGKAKATPDVGTERPAMASEEATKNLVGKLNNLVTVDLDNIVSAVDILMLVEFIPLQAALSIWFLYSILSWSALVGLATMLLLSPIPGYIATYTQKIQKEKMLRTDARVQTVTDIVNVFRMIKLFGWEPRSEEQLSQKRNEELEYAKKYKLLAHLVFMISYTIPLMVMLSTFFTYSVIMKQALTASKVFPAMAAFELLADSLQRTWWNIPMVVQGKVSLERVGEFLYGTELLDQFAARKDAIPGVQSGVAPSDLIGIREAAFTWSEEHDGTRTPGARQRTFVLRIADNLTFKRDCINLIIGPTGSGKTSLLMALLGEMHYIPTGSNSFVGLPRDAGIAYAAQESWIQNETIRDNILFGNPYNEERYLKVIDQCALKPDLSLFEAGDRTEVGERGLTLSGGQKARLTLARAVYSSAQILLLDDILAALDVHTAKWIVNRCFRGDLVRGRTVILVTHNVALAGPIADFVVALSSDGRIASQGSFANVLTNDARLSTQIMEESKEIEKVEQEIDATHMDTSAKESKDGKLVLEEDIAEGHVSWSAMKLYLNGLGGTHPYLFWAGFAGALFVSEFINSVQTWFVGYWAQQYEDHEPSEVNVAFYLDIYSLLLLSIVIIYGLGYVLWLYGTIRASRKIHRDLFASVLESTFRWLDKTPVSRIIARCTQDINAVDAKIPGALSAFLDICATMTVRFFAVMVFSPLFVIPGSIITLVGGFCGQMYMKAQMCVKREMSNAKAPVLGHFGAAMAGLPSIRAYGAQESFREELFRRIDRYTRAAVPFYNLNRWVCLRLDALVGGLFVALLAVYLVYGDSTRASTAGFSLTVAVSFSSMILWWIRSLNDVALNGNSLERIAQYLQIEHEPAPTKDGIPPAYWPASGNLKVEHLFARYSPDGPAVLHDISFEARSGERIGIVGRTGSGKSSLTLALLRCIITEGKVYYDGLPTDSVNLDALRSNITIIPQVPELLSGTLRRNLDPFDQHDDATLNDALRAAGLFSIQSETDEDRIALDSQIASGGSNLSVGQRQILALARAIVRQSKLLILDEATSAIDYATDSVIQRSLRYEIGKDVTLLTVAHRLQTIMDADKIMVLDAGRIVEFGEPSKLLKNEKGLLRALVEESGDKEMLYEMARVGSSSA
ncbi:P-loop containing nucleoside triphosphate hydrolase protein [Obba rivulosa]|uniref:P-loop containing nucleoside triphosphate hydrolase protein n=1 Tax=Obba rivulosa TaxID=1052685 RepID=A0A8E2ASR3_9APHY|nr:P-loop containing nucleoside triphosphate hydrolase protein [Obba rivulosa]